MRFTLHGSLFVHVYYFWGGSCFTGHGSFFIKNWGRGVQPGNRRHTRRCTACWLLPSLYHAPGGRTRNPARIKKRKSVMNGEIYVRGRLAAGQKPDRAECACKSRAQFWSRLLATRAASSPASRLAQMPPAAAVSPPVSTPSRPLLFTAFTTPWASR